MTEIVYQGDDIGNTIDEWLSKDNSVLPNSTKTIGNVGSIAINLDTKGGLGYQPTKGSSNNNKLADSLKKNKNKRKNGNEEELLETEQHGVVEEELLSRSTMGSKAKVTKHILNQQPEKKKAKNSEAGQGAATKNSDQTSNNDSNSALIRDKSQNVNEKTMKVEDHAENYDKNYWKQYKGGDFNEGDAPRKKSKTRSKQKNIRRDNRPALSRPSHLQIGSSDYAGRPLTYVSSTLREIL